MKEKITLSAFNILSVLTAVGILALVIFSLSLFPITFYSSPEFVLENITVEKAEDSDILKPDDSENWYKITYKMSVSSYALSPYSYKVEAFALKAPADFRNNGRYKLYLDEELNFTNTQADSYTLTLYVKSDKGTDYITELVKNSGFGMRKVTQSFSFFKYELSSNMPGFYVSDFENPQISILV